MLQPPNDKVVIRVKDKYVQHMSNILRLSSLENNTSIDPADFVSITGEVVSLPKSVSQKNKGFSIEDIKIGDIAIFSYQVIYDIIYKAETDKLEFRNMITVNDKEFFLADITKIFGVIRDEEIIMINGWVMLTEYPKSVIIMQNQSKKVKGTVQSEILNIGKPKTKETPIDAKKGDTVCFSPYKPQHYNINKKEFIILRQNQILGKV